LTFWGNIDLTWQWLCQQELMQWVTDPLLIHPAPFVLLFLRAPDLPLQAGIFCFRCVQPILHLRCALAFLLGTLLSF
jgi:hypothetical protein